MLKHTDIAVLRTSFDTLVQSGISTDNTECDSNVADSILLNETVSKLSQLVAAKTESLSVASYS